MANPDLNIGDLLAGLLGGVSLLLFGMQRITDAMKLIAGDRLKELLGSLSKTVMRGFFFVLQFSCIAAAAAMQSSTAVSVMLIGCTVVTQIIAFSSTKLSLLLFFLGFALSGSKSQRISHYGMLGTGMGLMLYGNQLVSHTTRSLRDFQPFLELLAHVSNPVVAVLVGAVMTVCVQASSAAIAITAALATQNLIPMRTALAFVLGANIGTTGTALFTSIGKQRAALRVSVCYLLQKIIGVVVVLPFLELLFYIIELTPSASPARRLANAHSLFNCVVAAIFLPLTHPLGRIVMRLVPEQAPVDRDQLLISHRI